MTEYEALLIALDGCPACDPLTDDSDYYDYCASCQARLVRATMAFLMTPACRKLARQLKPHLIARKPSPHERN